MFSDLSIKLAPVQSSNRGQKAFVFPFFGSLSPTSLLFLMSCQHKTGGVEGVQARGGGVGGQHPLAQTLGEQLDTWPHFKTKRAIQREIWLLWH